MSSVAAELLVLRKRASTWILLVVWVVLGLLFAYLLPYLTYTGGAGGTQRAPLELMLPHRLADNLLGGYPFFGGVLALMLGVLPYYVRAVLEVSEDAEGRWTSILTAVAIGAMLLAVPLFVRLAARTSKREAFSLAMLGSAAAFPLLFFAGFLPGVPALVQVLVGMAVVGAPIVGVYLFPGTITADICDDDANRTGLRREATFYGAQNFVEKTAGSAAPLILSGLLMLGNTAEHPLGIRLVGPVAGLLVFVGFWVFRRYDLPDEVELSPAVALPGVAETV